MDGHGLPPEKRVLIPTVVQIRRRHGKVVQGCDVYIGRECDRGGWDLSRSKWHNPQRVWRSVTPVRAVEAYRKYIRTRPELLAAIPELYGKTLGCWCKSTPSMVCHGDVLVELVIERLLQEHRASLPKDQESVVQQCIE